MCHGHVLDKVRYFVLHAGVTWYVDVYEGALSGIIIAEIELNQADQDLELPAWVGK